MGVPAFFRFLSKKYPKIITQVTEQGDKVLPDGTKVPPDYSQPNPLGEEIDNLYLDMNGIVHPCSHPEDRPPPETEDDMMLAVFQYTERIMGMVRPRKLLMIAVDGVAPRAKMNQQRSRRFRSAQEAEQKNRDIQSMIAQLREEGIEVDKSALDKKSWDSNAITPGTPFMDTLAAALRFWVVSRLNNDPVWRNVKVIISDASVPGEGEHKIMNFIRSQRMSRNHNPNTRHVIYGLDADLIMLGLATHEPHFRVLREDVFFQSGGGGGRSSRMDKETELRESLMAKRPGQQAGSRNQSGASAVKKPFIWLHVPVLREYLEAELYVPGLPFEFNLERCIDDFVFFIFFVGNDFLPHLPSLDIREGAIDTLISIWKRLLPAMGGYLTHNGIVNLDRAEMILQALGEMEDGIFERRKRNDDRAERSRNNGNNGYNSRGGYSRAYSSTAESTSVASSTSESYSNNGRNSSSSEKPKKRRKNAPPSPPADLQAVGGPKSSQGQMGRINRDLVNNRVADRLGIAQQSSTDNRNAAVALRAKLMGREEPVAQPSPAESSDGVHKRKLAEDDATVNRGEDAQKTEQSDSGDGKEAKVNGTGDDNKDDDDDDDDDDDEGPGDEVRLWEPGYRDRYYQAKFDILPGDTSKKRHIIRSYVEGFSWVLLYYYQGCPSWTWFYPYHFAPFASDFSNLSEFQVEFDLGTPFKPFEQLLGVLPAASKEFLPPALGVLMTNENSDIIDFYPEKFDIDLNGKKFAWQGVAILPFIDETRLLEAARSAYENLSPDELRRNIVGSDILYFSGSHPLYDELAVMLYGKSANGLEMRVELPEKSSDGLSGYVARDPECLPHSRVRFPLLPRHEEPLPDVESDTSLSVLYYMPQFEHTHHAVLLRGVRMPRPQLNSYELELVRQRSANHGNRRDQRGGYGMRGRYDGPRGRGMPPTGPRGNARPSYGAPSSFNTPAPAAAAPTGPRALQPVASGWHTPEYSTRQAAPSWAQPEAPAAASAAAAAAAAAVAMPAVPDLMSLITSQQAMSAYQAGLVAEARASATPTHLPSGPAPAWMHAARQSFAHSSAAPPHSDRAAGPGQPSAAASAAPSRELTQQQMAQWKEWQEKFRQKR